MGAAYRMTRSGPVEIARLGHVHRGLGGFPNRWWRRRRYADNWGCNGDAARRPFVWLVQLSLSREGARHMTAIDGEWTPEETPEKATTYKLTARDGEYLLKVGGGFVKVLVTGSAPIHVDPIIVEADRAPFRQAATRPIISD